MNDIHCSLSYHQTANSKLENFAVGVRDGWFNNPSVFLAPPETQLIFDGKITAYVNKYSAFKNGGKAQKGPFLTAKTALMTMLDTFAVATDGVALGDEAIILLGGYKPTKGSDSEATVPAQPVVTLKRGTTGVIKADCVKVAGAVNYGCLLSTLALSGDTKIDDGGQLIIASGDLIRKMDLNKKRRKQFTGLTPGINYFLYYYASNAAGVSQLSDVKSIMCA